MKIGGYNIKEDTNPYTPHQAKNKNGRGLLRGTLFSQKRNLNEIFRFQKLEKGMNFLNISIKKGGKGNESEGFEKVF